MTQVIVLLSYDLSNSDTVSPASRSDLTLQKQILNLLTESQREFVKQHTWRTEFNWHLGETELTIRKNHFDSREWSKIFFLFPEARLRKGPIK